jgi:hypothetical protein
MARASRKAATKKAAKRTAKKSVKRRAVTRKAASKKTAARKPAKRTVAKKAGAKKTVRRKVARKTKAERAHETLVANARHALELKNAAPKPFRPENRTPSTGMAPLPNQTIAPAEAIEAEEAYTARERAHKSG